jgi:hypothetical protein
LALRLTFAQGAFTVLLPEAFEVGQKLLLKGVGGIVARPIGERTAGAHRNRRQLPASQPLLQHDADLLHGLFAAGGAGVQLRQSHNPRGELARGLRPNDDPLV